MESLYLLIPLSVVLVLVIGVLFWWSVRSGQFDDLEGPAFRVVRDDDRPEIADEASAEGDDEPPGRGKRARTLRHRDSARDED